MIGDWFFEHSFFWEGEIFNFCSIVSNLHIHLVLRNMTVLPCSYGDVPEAVTMFNLAVKPDCFQQLYL